ncbi:MAG: hypothetical protein HFI93_03890 [Lachnospiraceae bacterium]|nr:hypothetical protein [Lachnospiraceae bacterium]
MTLGKENLVVVYFDYDTQAFAPVCTKADCSHVPGDMKCTANLIARNLSTICVYQNRLWYLKEKTGREKLSDPQSTLLCRADITGENEEILYTWEMSIFPGSVLYENCFYGVDIQDRYDENYQLAGFMSRLVSVDLESGEITEIEETEQTEIYPYYILGFYEGKIYYQYHPCEKYLNGAILAYDCKTREKEELSLAEGYLGSSKLKKNYLAYVMSDAGQTILYVIDLTEGKEISIPIAADISWRLFEEEILLIQDRRQYGRYHLETGKYDTVVGTDNFASSFSVAFSTGVGYVGRIVDENDFLTEYAYISKEDFDRADEPTVLTKDEYPIW